MSIKKRKLEEMNDSEKKTVRKATFFTLMGVAVICCILISCFSCSQDMGIVRNPELTDDQKAALWNTSIMDIWWAPQTDNTNDGVLKGLYLPRDVYTALDQGSGKMLAYFMINKESAMMQAEIRLTSESGQLIFANDDIWTVKFSEKNENLYMTITDSDGKTVYYSLK